jgi:hypothetical protein
MKQFALFVLSVWLCLGSSARATLVPVEAQGANTLDNFLVMCNSDTHSSLCTDDIMSNPHVQPETAPTGADPIAPLAAADPTQADPGTPSGSALAGMSQGTGAGANLSADLNTMRFVPTATSSNGNLITGSDPLAPTPAPEPASVAVLGICLAAFALVRLRASRRANRLLS